MFWNEQALSATYALAVRVVLPTDPKQLSMRDRIWKMFRLNGTMRYLASGSMLNDDGMLRSRLRRWRFGLNFAVLHGFLNNPEAL
jgi:hypothetical protein